MLKPWMRGVSMVKKRCNLEQIVGKQSKTEVLHGQGI